MSRSPHPRRGAFLTIALAFGAMLALANPLPASADVPTEVQLTFDPGTPVSGQNVEATAFIDWQTGPPPAGFVTLHVEDTGYTVTIPTVTSPTTHFTTATTSVGQFVGGSHVIDATFVSSLPGFAGSTSKTTIAVQGIIGTNVFFTLPTITVGKSVPLTAGLQLPSILYPAGGTLSFAVNGATVGSCVPQPLDAKNSAGCGITAPPPSHAGPYSATATFSNSPSYADASKTASGTAVAAPVQAHAAPSSIAPTPGPTATPTLTSTPRAARTASPTAAPAALADNSTPADPAFPGSAWPLILVAVLGAILGAGIVALILVLRRRRQVATSPE
jgi:hypothetical protein